MSRIGKMPISIPNNIEVSLNDGKLTFKSGAIVKELDTYKRVLVELKNNEIIFKLLNEERHSLAFFGTYRALANNIVIGLVSGFSKTLEINGVGYKAAVNGDILELALGFSHPIKFPIPDNISIMVERNLITIKGNDKQQVGQIAAKIREFRPPEPYKGKGVKYVTEKILRKAGKTSKK